jgi:hypothetical protein
MPWFIVPVFAQDFVGTEGSDTINGTEGYDTIQGRGGNDSLYGYGGDDVIFGDDGDDYLSGDDGDDTLIGGYGDDTYFISWSTRWGFDRIVEGAQNASENNRILLDYNSSDVAFFRSPFFSKDLIILFRYKGSQVTVDGFFDPNQPYIKTIQCNDITYTRAQVISMAK